MKVTFKNTTLTFAKAKAITASIVGDWRDGDALASGVSCRNASNTTGKVWGVGTDANWSDTVGKKLAKIIIYVGSAGTKEFFAYSNTTKSCTSLGTFELTKGMNTLDLSSANHVMSDNEYIGIDINDDNFGVFSTAFIKYGFGCAPKDGSGTYATNKALSTLMDLFFVDA